jgi:probable blue pigment (indigoidine) exporter
VGARPRAASLLGGVVGALGVGFLVLRAGFVVDPVGVAASLGAVTLSSVGYMLIKRWEPPVDMLTLTAWQMVAGGLALLPVALVVEGAPPHLGLRAIGGFLYLGLPATVLANALWFRSIRRLPAAAVSLVGLLNPVAGTVVGVALAHEVFGGSQALGLLLVLGGIVVGQPAVAGAVRDRLARRRTAERVAGGAAPATDDLPELARADAA